LKDLDLLICEASWLLVLIKICFSYKEDSSFTLENADTNCWSNFWVSKGRTFNLLISSWEILSHLKPFEPMIWTFVSTLLEYKGMMPFPLSFSV
jgi:hypothetical protein